MKMNNMPYKNNDFLEIILSWLQSNYPLIYGAILAVAVAYARLIYDGIERKNIWIEDVLCGLLSLAISNGVELIGISAKFSPFLGGAVGLIGVGKIRKIGIAMIKKRMGKE